MRTRIFPRRDRAVAHRAIRRERHRDPAREGIGVRHRAVASREILTDPHALEFLEGDFLHQSVETILGVDDDDLGAVAEDVVCHESRDGDEEAAGRRQQHLADAARQRTLVVETVLAQYGEGAHHADDRAQQPDHRRDDPDDRQVTVARAQALRLAQAVLGERVVEHVLAAADPFQAGLEGVGEVVAVGVADFPRFLVVASGEDLLERIVKRRRSEAVVTQG